MQVGEWDVTTVLDGTFLLDGGSMFGIVPRPLWSRHHPADERNRIVMALRGLLVRGGGRCLLVDCGIGPRFEGKQREIYGWKPGPAGPRGLLDGLAAQGVGPDDITDVIATHLHFDHVGGMLTVADDGSLAPTFPSARVHVQEECWNWACAPSIWDGASFFRDDFEVWEQCLDIRLLRGDGEVAPGVRVQVIGGHTPGQQIVVVGAGEGAVVYCADLMPTATHIRLPYIMAYDHQPLATLEEKKILLAEALEGGWVLVFEHDPLVEACRLQEKDGRVVQGETLEL